MHDRAGTEEKAGLEEGVGEQMEDAAREVAGTDAHEHETELTDGGVGEDLLEVVLAQGDHGREERGQRAHTGHDGQRRRGQQIHGAQPRHHVHAGGDHGGRVNQCRNRCGTRHGIRQPDVERDLR